VDFASSVIFSPFALVVVGIVVGFLWGVVFATVMHAARAPRTSRQNRNSPVGSRRSRPLSARPGSSGPAQGEGPMDTRTGEIFAFDERGDLIAKDTAMVDAELERVRDAAQAEALVEVSQRAAHVATLGAREVERRKQRRQAQKKARKRARRS
jgi:hypothetical protein